MRQDFIDTPWRDHKIISVEMNETSERGPGQWALKTDLLKDPKFLEEVEDQWKYFAQVKDKFSSKLVWWDREKPWLNNCYDLLHPQKNKQNQTLKNF